MGENISLNHKSKSQCSGRSIICRMSTTFLTMIWRGHQSQLRMRLIRWPSPNQCAECWQNQWFSSSQNVCLVNPKNIYFHYLKNLLRIKISRKHTFFNFEIRSTGQNTRPNDHLALNLIWKSWRSFLCQTDTCTCASQEVGHLPGLFASHEFFGRLTPARRHRHWFDDTDTL